MWLGIVFKYFVVDLPAFQGRPIPELYIEIDNDNRRGRCVLIIFDIIDQFAMTTF